MIKTGSGELNAGPAKLVTFKGVAHPWMCDAMGHVNVRHYAAMFDDASFHLLGQIAGATSGQTTLGWADVRIEIDYMREVAAGTLLTITSHVEKVGNSSLTYVHMMSGSFDCVEHARARVVTLRFDLSARRKVDLEPAVRTNLDALTGGVGRS